MRNASTKRERLTAAMAPMKTLEACAVIPIGYWRAEDRLFLDGGTKWGARLGTWLGFLERQPIHPEGVFVRLTPVGRAALAGDRDHDQ
jgi:hypothetical protein